MVAFLLRLHGLSNAAQEQTRLPAGCEERVYPAATNACVLQIAIKAVVTSTREHPDGFESGELEAIRTVEVDYYGGGLKTPMALLERATYLAEQGLFKGKPSSNSSLEQF